MYIFFFFFFNGWKLQWLGILSGSEFWSFNAWEICEVAVINSTFGQLNPLLMLYNWIPCGTMTFPADGCAFIFFYLGELKCFHSTELCSISNTLIPHLYIHINLQAPGSQEEYFLSSQLSKNKGLTSHKLFSNPVCCAWCELIHGPLPKPPYQ